MRENAVKGRPEGTKTTEPSDLVSRLRKERGLTQIQMAQELEIPFSTFRRYDADQLLPTAGPVRQAIIRAAKRAGVSVSIEAEKEVAA